MPKFTLRAGIFTRNDENGDWTAIYSDEWLRKNIGRKIKIHKFKISRFVSILSETQLIAFDLQPKNPYSKIPGTDRYTRDPNGVHQIGGQWPFYTLDQRQPIFIQADGTFSTSRTGNIVEDLKEVRRSVWRERKRTQIAKSKVYRVKITPRGDGWRWAIHRIGRGGKLMKWGLADDHGSAVYRANQWIQTYNTLSRRFPAEFS